MLATWLIQLNSTMPRPQFSLKTLLVLAITVPVACGSVVSGFRTMSGYGLFLMDVWGAFFAGYIGARKDGAHGILAAFFAFFFLWPLWAVIAGTIGLMD